MLSTLQTLAPARSQFRALCYRQTSARIGHAVAKASVMRLQEVHCLPSPQLVPSSVFAWNCPGPADSFSPSVPLTYASFLGSLPPPPSLSSSCAISPWFPSVLRCALYFSPLRVIGLRSHLVMNSIKMQQMKNSFSMVICCLSVLGFFEFKTSSLHIFAWNLWQMG